MFADHGKRQDDWTDDGTRTIGSCGLYLLKFRRRFNSSRVSVRTAALTSVLALLLIPVHGQVPIRAPMMATAKLPQVFLAPTEVVLSHHPHQLPVTGLGLVRSKVMDTATLQIREVVTDATTGRELSYEDAAHEEAQQARLVRGAADSKLHRRLARARHDERIRVGVRPLVGHEAMSALHSPASPPP